jgi:uncharacterized membrane protein
MNDAHLHMVVNHFPLIGPILGMGVLIAGLILRNNSVKNTAYFLFIVAAVFAAFSMGTGEGAEEIAEKLPSVTKQIIYEHEEYAEKLAILLYVLGVFSLVALYLNFKRNSKEKIVSFFILGIGIISLFFVQKVGTSGGQVRHTEIRSDFISTSGTEQNGVEKTDEQDKD